MFYWRTYVIKSNMKLVAVKIIDAGVIEVITKKDYEVLKHQTHTNDHCIWSERFVCHDNCMCFIDNRPVYTTRIYELCDMTFESKNKHVVQYLASQQRTEFCYDLLRRIPNYVCSTVKNPNVHKDWNS